MAQLEIRMLGPFEVYDGAVRVAIAPGRGQALLASLALSAGTEVSIEQLADMVWGEDVPGNLRRTVQTNVKRLRATLGRDTIRTGGAGYVLDVDPSDVDALRFVRLLDAAASDPAAERDRIVDALRLWRGSPLDGIEADWLIGVERPRLVERYLSATERRIDLALAAGPEAESLAEVREVAGRYPLRESLWARLIVLLDRTGRTAEALECYETVRVRIADDLGVDPGVDLRRIHAELLRGEPVEPAASPDSAPSTPPVPRQLPADSVSFTGRSAALVHLDSLLAADRGSRIAALHGAGGIGKTTLAIHWAHRVSDRFPDGQLYVNLQGFGPGKVLPPNAALESLLRGLGVAVERLPADVETRSALLRTTLAERTVLLILDNAGDVEQVRPLLPGGGTSFVVVTSRNQLRGLSAREGADRMTVDTLPIDDATRLLASGLRRRQVAHTDEMLSDLAELCGRLPLAMAVAVEQAGREQGSDLADVVAELRDERRRLDALDVGDDPVTDVRAVLSWSYEALDDETARTFRLLGLHIGPDVSLPAAAALVGESAARTRRLLDRLVDVHLVRASRSGRYAMHDLVRTYAAELVERIDDPAARERGLGRLLNWYVHSTYDANISLSFGRRSYAIDTGVLESGVEPAQFADYQQARAWFDTEWQSMVRAVTYAADNGMPGSAYRIVSKSFEFLHQHRPAVEAVELAEIGVRAADAAGDRVAQGFLVNQLGVAHGRVGNSESHVRCLERARSIFEQEDIVAGELTVLMNLGQAYRSVGRLDDARWSLERALALPSPRDSRATSGLLVNLSRVHLDAGRSDDAATTAAEAARNAQASGNRRAEALSFESLGMAYAVLERLSCAEDAFRKALEINRDLAYRGDEAIVLAHLGRVQRDASRTAQARDSWERALEILDEVGETDPSELTRDELLGLIDATNATDPR